MSIQSEWQPASKDEPAHFTHLDWADIKVQAVTDGKQIQVRLATEFDIEWQERRFDEWYQDMESHTDDALEAAYPVMKAVLPMLEDPNDLAVMKAAIKELESRNAGLIRG